MKRLFCLHLCLSLCLLTQFSYSQDFLDDIYQNKKVYQPNYLDLDNKNEDSFIDEDYNYNDDETNYTERIRKFHNPNYQFIYSWDYGWNYPSWNSWHYPSWSIGYNNYWGHDWNWSYYSWSYPSWNYYSWHYPSWNYYNWHYPNYFHHNHHHLGYHASNYWYTGHTNYYSNNNHFTF